MDFLCDVLIAFGLFDLKVPIKGFATFRNVVNLHFVAKVIRAAVV